MGLQVREQGADNGKTTLHAKLMCGKQTSRLASAHTSRLALSSLAASSLASSYCFCSSMFSCMFLRVCCLEMWPPRGVARMPSGSCTWHSQQLLEMLTACYSWSAEQDCYCVCCLPRAVCQGRDFRWVSLPEWSCNFVSEVL